MAPKKRKTGKARSKRDETSDIEDELPSRPPRPFIESEGLPLSKEEPEYAILNNALSLKDSTVLYSSLMKSRKAYTNGNVFDLFWAKGKTKLENDSNARDRMNKLNDCVMDLGPHTFDVRFFILKDDEIEKKREEEKERKKAKRLASKKAREEKKQQRELKKTKKDEDMMTTESSINPSTAAETGVSDDKNVEGEAKEDQKGDNSDDNDDNEDDDDDDDEEEKSDAESEAPTRGQTPDLALEAPRADGTDLTKEVRSINKDSKAPETQRDTSLPVQPKPLPPLQVNSSKSEGKKETKATPTKPTIKKSKVQKQDSSSTDPMQTPESQMMIANLNAIARTDPSLNALMKIVATGNAKPEQIREFQGYIQRAKAMGPSPYFKQQYPNYQAPVTKEPKEKKEKPVKLPKKPPKKPKPPKEKQLTTFQELYVNGADLVFEFSENPNVRYNLPKNCIYEKLGGGEILISYLVIHNRDQIKKFKERQKIKKEKQEKKDQELKEKEEKRKATEEQKQETDAVKPEVEGIKEAPEAVLTPERSRRTRKKRSDLLDEINDEAEKCKEKEELKKEKIVEKKIITEEEEPIPYFSALTFKLSNMHERYDPIFFNSFDKQEDVKVRMEEIINNGIRVPKHYVWYSVDAYQDEDLAENLRYSLHLIENPPKGKYKKRIAEEKPILPKDNKRIKT